MCAVGGDRKIERAEFRIRHQPGRLDRSAGSERETGVVTFAIRTAAGIQPFNRAAVTNDTPIRVERQHPVGAAIEKEQPFVPIGGEAAWIGNAAVIAEGTERPG